jgi:hypothetical protein
MKIELLEFQGKSIAEVSSEEIIINNVQDALDLIGNCDYQGARNIIINKKNICDEFFDLSTGIAGEILQKFSTYRVKLAIVGYFSSLSSKSLKDFIYESNKIGRILFVSTAEEARLKIAE